MASVSWQKSAVDAATWSPAKIPLPVTALSSAPIPLNLSDPATPLSAARRATASSWLIAAGLLLLATAAETQPTLYAAPTSLFQPHLVLSVLFVTAAVVVGCLGWVGTLEALRRVISPRSSVRSDVKPRDLLQFTAASAMAWGFIRTQAALVASLGALDDPGEVGPHVAAALTAQMYGVALALGCVCVEARCSPRPRNAARILRRSSLAGGLTIVAGAITTLICFCMIRLSMAPAF